MTKLLSSLAIGLLLGAGAGAASASNTFGLSEVQGSQTLIQLGTVVAGDNGLVEVYDYHAGREGRLLGSKVVRAGANTDVKVSLTPSSTDKVVAVLLVDGQAVARQVIRIDN
ncbi:hypothetical protein [Rubellimicrobium roseum]|uniref:Uncharacterized protein n=1 Tax=Rubellimicrobium roseum TaxID=687525 RepID=A0A5C4N9R8_9RHOB|nr:hypothetical protein [Rubellimicrobium roseum]TNC60904.1 hypothetical protein FHG71_21710 [Rubellimicrobium roseum]